MRIALLAICLVLGFGACDRTARHKQADVPEASQIVVEPESQSAQPVDATARDIPFLNGAALPDLSWAQLHREDRGSYSDCERAGKTIWQCDDSRVEHATAAQVAPDNVAPFLAQIYLHPEHITEAFIHTAKRYDRSARELRHVCGGALIAPGWVVTAADCFPNASVDQQYGLRLGVQDITNDAGHLYKVVEVIRRDPDKPPRDNDIALVRFDPSQTEATAVSFAQLIQMAPDIPGIIAANYETDGAWSGVITNDGQYHVIDPHTLQTELSLPFFQRVTAVANRKAVLTIEKGSAILITPMADGSPQRIEFAGVTDAQLVDNDTLIVGWDRDTDRVRIFNQRTGALMREHVAQIHIDSVSEIADAPRLALKSNDGGIEIIDLFPEPDHSGTAISVAWSQWIRPVGSLADNRRLIYEYRPTQTYYLHDAVDDVAVATIESYGFPIALSDGKTKILHQYPDSLDIIDAMSGVLVAQIPVFNASENIDITFLNHDRFVLIRDRSGKFAEIWDLNTTARRAFHTPPSALERLETVTLLPDSDTILFRTRQAAIYQSSNSDAILVPERHRFYLNTPSHSMRMTPLLATHPLTDASAAFDQTYSVLNPNASDLIVWSPQGRSFYWNLNDCPPSATLCEATRVFEHDTYTKKVQLSDDVQHLIATMANGAIQVWPLARNQLPTTFYHGGDVRGVAVVDSGRQLMSYGMNGYVRFWDIETGKERARLSFVDSTPKRPFVAQTDAVTMASGPMSDAAVQTAEDASPIVTYVNIDTRGEALTDGVPVRVFGWGRFEDFVGGQPSPQLRDVNLEVMPRDACGDNSRHNSSRDDEYARIFCARDVARSTCVSNGGAPVIHGETLAEAMLVGLTNRGSKDCRMDGTPSVYVRIASHADWIKSIIQNEYATAEAVAE